MCSVFWELRFHFSLHFFDNFWNQSFILSFNKGEISLLQGLSEVCWLSYLWSDLVCKHIPYPKEKCPYWIIYLIRFLGIKYNQHPIWKKNVTLDNIYSIIFYPLDKGPSWPWSYGSWIYNYLCIKCLATLMLWVRISIRAKCTTLCDKDCQWLATGQWFSAGPPVSSTNKTDHQDITEILELNTIKQTNKSIGYNFKNIVSHCNIFQWVSDCCLTQNKHQPATSHRQTLSHNVVHLSLSGIRTHTISVFRLWCNN